MLWSIGLAPTIVAAGECGMEFVYNDFYDVTIAFSTLRVIALTERNTIVAAAVFALSMVPFGTNLVSCIQFARVRSWLNSFYLRVSMATQGRFPPSWTTRYYLAQSAGTSPRYHNP